MNFISIILYFCLLIRLNHCEELHETHHHRSLKHEARKHNRNYRSIHNEYAIMYKDDKPIGILEQKEDNYQLLPVELENSIPVDVSDIEKRDVSFTDDKYPYIFAKFKVDSKIEKLKPLEKRETKLFNEKAANNLRSTLNRIEDAGAEDELKSLLNDMGLIEDIKQKREAEDEDLEKNSVEMVNNQQHEVVTEYLSDSIGFLNENKEVQNFLKQHPEMVSSNEDREKRASDDEITNMIRQQLNAKMDKIREEVKNEIEKLQANSKDEDEDRKKREDTEKKRTKRSIDLERTKSASCKCSGKDCKCGKPFLEDGEFWLDPNPASYKLTEDSKREKRNTDPNHPKPVEQQLTLEDMEGEDLFGPLQQSFEGELSRVKRIKRE